MVTIKLRGPELNNWFAEQLVRAYGADTAREKTCGPMSEAVERVIRRNEDEAKDHEYELGMLHG